MTDQPEPAPSLRDQYALALEREDALHWGYDHSFASTYGVDPETDGFVDAVLAVRDREMQQLAAARDELAGILAAVLSAFPADLNPGGPAVPSRRLPAELINRWRTALDGTGPTDREQPPAAAWTPPPPGDTREQLPDAMLALIREQLPDYLSTACQTADTLSLAACYPRSGVPRPQYDEIREHAERLHNRCRINQKFTGQLCVCGCH